MVTFSPSSSTCRFSSRVPNKVSIFELTSILFFIQKRMLSSKGPMCGDAFAAGLACSAQPDAAPASHWQVAAANTVTHGTGHTRDGSLEQANDCAVGKWNQPEYSLLRCKQPPLRLSLARVGWGVNGTYRAMLNVTRGEAVETHRM